MLQQKNLQSSLSLFHVSSALVTETTTFQDTVKLTDVHKFAARETNTDIMAFCLIYIPFPRHLYKVQWDEI
jgi:hypothetical protein